MTTVYIKNHYSGGLSGHGGGAVLTGIAFAIFLLCCTALPAHSQAIDYEDVVEAQVNVPYVVQFGFGSYDVGGLSTNTFRIPLGHTFALGDGNDSVRLKFTGYLGYSYADFETSWRGRKLTASQDYVFIMPHFELQIPLAPGWTIKPYAAVGAGCAFSGSVELEGWGRLSTRDTYDFLYSGGLASLFEKPIGGFTAGFGTRLGWAEEVPLSGGGGQGYATFQTGLELRHPIGISLAERGLELAGSFIYYYFFPAAEFSMAHERPLKVSNQYEFGTTIGFAGGTNLWIFDNPRIGASYRFGDGLTGFRVNLGFPF